MLLALPILTPLSTAIVLHLLPQHSRLLRMVAFAGSIGALAASVTALFATFPDLRLAGEPESRGTFVLRGYRSVPVSAG